MASPYTVSGDTIKKAQDEESEAILKSATSAKKDRAKTAKSTIKAQKDQSFIDGLHEDWTGALPFTILFAKNTGKVVDYWEGKKSKKKFLEAIGKSIRM
mgnify:CR=1 FL=1